MTRAFAKSDRIGQVERLLLTSRVPLSQAEIARRCEVHRSTIGRLVQGMIDNGIPVLPASPSSFGASAPKQHARPSGWWEAGIGMHRCASGRVRGE